jgi:hypothetical protein
MKWLSIGRCSVDLVRAGIDERRGAKLRSRKHLAIALNYEARRIVRNFDDEPRQPRLEKSGAVGRGFRARRLSGFVTLRLQIVKDSPRAREALRVLVTIGEVKQRSKTWISPLTRFEHRASHFVFARGHEAARFVEQPLRELLNALRPWRLRVCVRGQGP